MGGPEYILDKKKREKERRLLTGDGHCQNEKKRNHGIETNVSGDSLVQRSCDSSDEIQMNGISSTGNEMIQKQDKEENDPYKLELPEFGSSLGYKPKPLSFGLPELKMDPKIAFEIEMMKIRSSRLLSTDYLKQAAGKIDYNKPPALMPYGPQLPPYNPLLGVQPPTPKPKPEPKNVALRPGKMGDIVKAILAIPEVKLKLDKIKNDAEKIALDIYEGNEALIITSGILVAGGTVAGLLAAGKDTRLDLLEPFISGAEIPIPGTPVSVTYTSLDAKSIIPEAKDDAPKVEQIMLKVNIGSLLPKGLGFK